MTDPKKLLEEDLVPDYSADADDIKLKPAGTTSFWDVEAPTGPPISALFIRDGESAMIRFVAPEPIPARLHFGALGGGNRAPIRCNADSDSKAPCAACLAGLRLTPVHLLPVLNLDQDELAVLTLYEDAGAGSLRGQMGPLIKRPDFTNLMVEVTKNGGRYQVRLRKVLDPTKPDGFENGDAVLRDVMARGLPTKEDLLATIDSKTNGELLTENPVLERKIALRYPQFDLSQLRS